MKFKPGFSEVFGLAFPKMLMIRVLSDRVFSEVVLFDLVGVALSEVSIITIIYF